MGPSLTESAHMRVRITVLHSEPLHSWRELSYPAPHCPSSLSREIKGVLNPQFPGEDLKHLPKVIAGHCGVREGGLW